MTIISRLELPHFQRSAGLVLGRAEFPAAEVNSSAEPNMQADGACNEASKATQESAVRANEAIRTYQTIMIRQGTEARTRNTRMKSSQNVVSSVNRKRYRLVHCRSSPPVYRPEIQRNAS